MISTEHTRSADARHRFSTEAKAAARLRSRYVVQVYDDGETPEGTPYIVLEYLDGETLEQRLERERDLPLNDAVRITRHVARALSRAHASGIVHRDLKPGNVFLTRSEDDEVGWGGEGARLWCRQVGGAWHPFHDQDGGRCSGRHCS